MVKTAFTAASVLLCIKGWLSLGRAFMWSSGHARYGRTLLPRSLDGCTYTNSIPLLVLTQFIMFSIYVSALCHTEMLSNSEALQIPAHSHSKTNPPPSIRPQVDGGGVCYTGGAWMVHVCGEGVEGEGYGPRGSMVSDSAFCRFCLVGVDGIEYCRGRCSCCVWRRMVESLAACGK